MQAVEARQGASVQSCLISEVGAEADGSRLPDYALKMPTDRPIRIAPLSRLLATALMRIALATVPRRRLKPYRYQ